MVRAVSSMHHQQRLCFGHMLAQPWSLDKQWLHNTCIICKAHPCLDRSFSHIFGALRAVPLRSCLQQQRLCMLTTHRWQVRPPGVMICVRDPG